MKRLVLAAVLALGFTMTAQANELDNESSVTNKEISGTLIVRVDSRNNQTAVMSANQISSEAQAQDLAKNGQFENANGNVKTELDQDGAASSWYFYRGYNSYYNCNVNWYGNWYQPRYSYSYGYYSYYYYANYWW